MVAQAHIDSNTCGSHGSSEQQQYICLGDRSACCGVFCSCLIVLFLLCLLLCGGLFHVCYICSSSISYMLTAACCVCIGSSKSRCSTLKYMTSVCCSSSSMLHKPSTFPSSTCIDLLRGDSCMLYGGYSMYVIFAAAVFRTRGVSVRAFSKQL